MKKTMEEKPRSRLYLLHYKPAYTWELREDIPGISSCEESYYQNRFNFAVKTEPIDYGDSEQTYLQQHPQNELQQETLQQPTRQQLRKEQRRWQHQLWQQQQQQRRQLQQQLEQLKPQKQQQVQVREQQRRKKQQSRKEIKELKRLQEELRRKRRLEDKQRLEMEKLRRLQRQQERQQEQQLEQLKEQLQRQQKHEIQQEGRLRRKQLREEKLKQEKQGSQEENDCQTTTSDVTHSCSLCSKTFSSEMSLKGHERYCNVDFSCNRCHKKLTNSQRYHHMKTCRPYECIHCERKFKLIGGYHAHLSKYCPVLHQILPQQNRYKIYVCEHCGNKCDGKSLKTHICCSSGTKTWTCLACGQVLKNREQFKIHICAGKKLDDNIQVDGLQTERCKKQQSRKEIKELKRLQDELRRKRRQEDKQRLEMDKLRRLQRQQERQQEQQLEQLKEQLQRQQKHEIQQQGRLQRQQLREEKFKQQKQGSQEENDCQTTTSDVTHSCSLCSKTFSSVMSLNGHKRYCNVDISCNRCHKKLTNSQRNHHKKTCRPYECIHCKQKFKLKGGYHAHLSKYCPVLHQIPPQQNRYKIYVCEHCGNKYNGKSLKTHMCFSSAAKTWTCLACGQVLKNREQFKIHICDGKKLNDNIKVDGLQTE